MKTKPWKLTTYKMRAECAVDVGRFLTHPNLICNLAIGCDDDDGTGDVVVEFTSHRTLADLLAILRTVADGHVMVETLNYFEKYTGDRDDAVAL